MSSQWPTHGRRAPQALQSDFSKFGFASNKIEGAGFHDTGPPSLGQFLTSELCNAIFLNEPITDITNRILLKKQATTKEILEVTNHAEAFQFLVKKLVFEEGALLPSSVYQSS